MTKKTAHQLTNNQKGLTLILIIVIVTVVAIVSFLAYETFSAKSNNPPNLQQITSTRPRSKAPGVITQVVLATGIDPKTGTAVNPTNTFAKTDQVIYAVVSLKNPKVGTKIEYTRYLNDKFLDNRSLTTTKATTNNVIFDWQLRKPGTTHLLGNYRVKVYTDGIFEKEVKYQVK